MKSNLRIPKQLALEEWLGPGPGDLKRMNSFTIRWRSARKHQEHELTASEAVAAPLLAALEDGGGLAVWQSGTVWKCPGCGDRTVMTEEFLEGMRRAESLLRRQNERHRTEDAGGTEPPRGAAALAWLDEMAARMLGCERDRVYIKDDSGRCTYGNTSYTSRI